MTGRMRRDATTIIVVNPSWVRGQFPVTVRWADRPGDPMMFWTATDLASYVEFFEAGGDEDGPSFTDARGRPLLVRIDRCALRLLAIDQPGARHWAWYVDARGRLCAIEFVGEGAVRALVVDRPAGTRSTERSGARRRRHELVAMPPDWAEACEIIVCRDAQSTAVDQTDPSAMWDRAVGQIG